MPASPRNPAQALGQVRGAPPALVLNADAWSVRRTLGVVIDQLDSEGLDREELGAVELVLAEVLNNVVEHAAETEDEEIQLWWTLGPSGLLVRVADTGREMSEDHLPFLSGRCASQHATLVPEGGFGWFLIGGLARNIVYRRERGVNVLTFRMILGEACQSEALGPVS